MVQVTYFRTRKICYFLLFFLIAGIYVLTQQGQHNSVEDSDPALIGIELPNLNDFLFHSKSASACKSNNSSILAIVHSSPSNVPHRAVIRQTWGSSKVHGIRTVFVVGESANSKIRHRVFKEAEEHGDLILPIFTDSYKNLTLKHLLGLKWALENCPDVPVILKTDDDAFVDTIRIPKIVNLIFATGSVNTLVCHVIPEGTAPKRSGKWKVSREEYPFEEYPEYCSGIAYLAQLSTMRKIFDLAPSVPYLPIDDVFVTGLAATFAGIKRQDLGVRFADTEQPVIEWMRSKSLRPCPWMVAEISPYYWPTHAFQLWDKTVKAWHKSSQR